MGSQQGAQSVVIVQGRKDENFIFEISIVVIYSNEGDVVKWFCSTEYYYLQIFSISIWTVLHSNLADVSLIVALDVLIFP